MGSLVFKNISKIYPGGVTAVRNFNLEIKDKEFIILVGPSGCGKSTMLRMVAGLEDISEGELYIDDRIVNDIPPKDRDIAMVFQSYALYPHMTVYENMAFGLKLRKAPKDDIDKKVRTAAKSLGIEGLLDRKPKAMSGGQKQRVALGRAIVRNPRVQTRAKIIKLHNELKTTFIYVTHDQLEAMTMADRIVVMKDGIIQQVAVPQELYENPVNLFVAGFIGSPQMNFIDVKAEENERECMLVFGNTRINLPFEKAEILRKGGYLGEKVIMGIRPEDIHDEPEFLKGSEDSTVEARIDVVEMVGSEAYLHFITEGVKAVARVGSGSKARTGDIVKLAFDKNKIYLFDAKTEESIL